MFVGDQAVFAFRWQKSLYLFILALYFVLIAQATYAQSPSATVTVNIALNPADDPGQFNLAVNGNPVAAATPTIIEPGLFSVSETGGAGTTLTDYTVTIACFNQTTNVTTSGSGPTLDNVQANDGNIITCTVTNTHKGQLTLNKALSPTSDPGKFVLQIDNFSSSTAVGNGGSLGPQTLDAGAHTVGESAGNGIDLANYNRTLACKADSGKGSNVAATPSGSSWSVNVNAGDNVVCTLTNTRKTITLIIGRIFTA